jgi:hypothetical protein
MVSEAIIVPFAEISKFVQVHYMDLINLSKEPEFSNQLFMYKFIKEIITAYNLIHKLDSSRSITIQRKLNILENIFVYNQPLSSLCELEEFLSELTLIMLSSDILNSIFKGDSDLFNEFKISCVKLKYRLIQLLEHVHNIIITQIETQLIQEMGNLEKIKQEI